MSPVRSRSLALSTLLLTTPSVALAQPAAPPAEPAQPPAPPPAEAAPAPPAMPPAPPQETPTFVVGRWAMTLYGFAELDTIYDTTQSFSEVAGNGQVERPSPVVLPPPFQLPAPAAATRYAGEHGRLQMSARNSRLGLRVKAPDVGDVRPSGVIEFDLLGNQPLLDYSSTRGGVSEGATYTNPALRVRHAYVEVETPIVDVLVGQYWDLMGWQGVYHPNTVEIQGVPGQLYSRTPQIRVMKTGHFSDFTVEGAIAAMRPPQRDSETPEGQAGVRVSYERWRATTTNGATSTVNMPLSLALTGDLRNFAVPDFSQTPTHEVSRVTTAFAVDAFVPVLRSTKENRANSLALNGEFVSGSGIADLYTGLTGGAAFPNVTNTVPINPPYLYPQNVDNGMIIFDTSGKLHAIQWTTFIVGVQYYLPVLDSKLWVSANFSYVTSNNLSVFTRTDPTFNPLASYYQVNSLVRDSETWWDVNFFADVVQPVRLGLEYANFNDKYADGVHAINHRVQLSGFFLF
jgi:hypothetical protein